MRILNYLLALVIFGACTSKAPVYKNKSADVESRVQDLLKRMTLEEKVRQLDMYDGNALVEGKSMSLKKAQAVIGTKGIGSLHDYYPESAEYANDIQKYAIENTRLGVPIIFIEEALHGYQGVKSTAFPVPIGLASMWDVDAMKKVGEAIGAEARSVGVHMVLSPVLGIGREPRWGRIEETYGEDPYLAARNGVSIIKGMQGDDLTRDDKVVAEPKHYGVHSAPEGGGNTAPVYCGEREARTNFLYVFEKAFREGGALGVMAAYHELDGIPCVSNPWLLKTILREEWGFKGFVLSDLGAINMQTNSHGTAKTQKEAIANAINSGLDMQFYDYEHDVFENSIIEAVKDKTLKMENLDRAVASVLRVKFILGLFDNPYIDVSLKSKRYHNQKHQNLALETAQKSIVLLQNKNNVLPLKQNVKSVAVIGEFSDKVMLGGYSPKEVEGISILNAFRKSNYKIDYIDATIPSSTLEPIDSKYFETKDGQRGLKAEFFNNLDLKGTPVATQVETNLSPYWHNLSPAGGVGKDNFSVRYTGYLVPKMSGTYSVGMVTDDKGRMFLNNKKIVENWDNYQVNVMKSHEVRLEKGKKYPVKIEYGEVDNYAGMMVKWKLIKKDEEQKATNIFIKAANRAKISDVVVLVLGESKSVVGEGKDKSDLELDKYSKKLISEVSKIGKPIILVLQNGRPLILNDEIKLADAILETWYAGEKQGEAVVDIISGKVNPSGKLPVSFPRSMGQLPIYYNHKKTSRRGYVDGTSQPLFAFGHGLSYSTFKYSDLKIENKTISKNQNQKVTVSVKNTSDIAGEEIVQLYITDVFSSVATSKIQLRGFKRVNLNPGEKKSVEFTLTPEDLSLWNRDMKRVVEPGEFKIQVGTASDKILLTDTFIVK